MKNKWLLIALAFLAALSQSLVAMGGVFVVTLLCACEKEEKKKVFQPLLLGLSVFAVNNIFLLFLRSLSNTIQLFGEYVRFFNAAAAVIDLILMWFLLVMLVLGLIFMLRGKDMPLYGKLVDKLTQEKASDKNEEPAQDEVIIEEE